MVAPKKAMFTGKLVGLPPLSFDTPSDASSFS